MSGRKWPNILWYCTVAQRYDTIHALGNAYIRAPILDTLVRKGVAFTRAYAQSTMCTPSRVSFLTGRCCASHHVYHRHDLGELFDLHEDPGEFVDLWSDPAHRILKLEVMHRHIDAVMSTISAGPRRATQY